MQTIEIRGEIVSSLYDGEWFQEYIDRGIITPESHFRRQLDAVKKEDVEVYINSPGGSCFAGFEMINTAKDWRARTGKNLSVTIGSMAASMASAFAVIVGGKFRVHKNTKLMFHSAWGGTVGGPDAMRDEAELLDKINADIKTALVTRYALDSDIVDEWFSEGRMGWLNADEANAAGMVIDIVDSDAAHVMFAAEDIKNLGSRGLNIAACLNAIGTPQNESDKPMEKTYTQQQLDDSYDAGLDAGKLESKVAEYEQAKSDIEVANAEKAELSDKLEVAVAEKEELNTRVVDLLRSAETAKADHENALAELNASHEAAAAELKQQHADQISAFNKDKEVMQEQLNKLTPGMAGTDEDKDSNIDTALAAKLANVTTPVLANFAASMKLSKR